MLYMKTMIDLDDDLLEAASKELGTSTKKDTVNAALKYTAERGQRARTMLEEIDLASTIGIGADMGNPEIMKGARR